jgi:hypothetical protein
MMANSGFLGAFGRCATHTSQLRRINVGSSGQLAPRVGKMAAERQFWGWSGRGITIRKGALSRD